MPAKLPSSEQISVALVEPGTLLREIASKALETIPDIALAWSVAGSRDAREAFARREVDVIVTELDLDNGNGVGLGLSLRKLCPKLGVVLIVDEIHQENLAALEGVNMQGWRVILRSDISGLDHLVREIKQAAAGQVSFNFNAVPGIFENVTLSSLTPRQSEVLRELASGLANPAIAEKLGIEVSSVVNHLTAIYNALSVPENANPRVFSTLTYHGLLPDKRVGA